eukprot:13515848-Heterocapsa_arctica.AAC.1
MATGIGSALTQNTPCATQGVPSTAGARYSTHDHLSSGIWLGSGSAHGLWLQLWHRPVAWQRLKGLSFWEV